MRKAVNIRRNTINKKIAKKLDKFYTNDNVAAYIIDKTKEVLSLDEKVKWLEPSAGSGAFSNKLSNVLAYDLYPENNSIIKQDFLELNLQEESLITIGNPPYGTRSKLAVQFINHANKFSQAISFVLPITFLKWSTQKQVAQDLKLVYTETLEENSFTIVGEPFEIRTCFQIWAKKTLYPELKDLRLKKAPPITLKGEFNIWQHNATEGSRKHLYENWKYASWRQGYKDYNSLFTQENFDEVKKIVYETNLQLFFFEPLTKEAEEVFLKMDLNELSKRNMSTPGFGKSDFIQFYLETKEKALEVGFTDKGKQGYLVD